MFGNSLFGHSPIGQFFSKAFAEIDENKRLRAKEECHKKHGITTKDFNGKTYFGSESLEIPFIFNNIELKDQNYLYCYKVKQLPTDYNISVFTIDGTPLFSGDKIEYLGSQCFLVDNEFNDHEYKIENRKYKTIGMSPTFNEQGFCILGRYVDEDEKDLELIKSKYNKVVVNIKGEEIFEIDSMLEYPSLNGCILCYKRGYINLLTGEQILEYAYSTAKSKQYIFAELPDKKVFQINTVTGEVTVWE